MICPNCQKPCTLVRKGRCRACKFSGRVMRPAERVRIAAALTGFRATDSQRDVPMAYLPQPTGWSSICWFHRLQYYKVFLNGKGFGCARTVEGVLLLVADLREAQIDIVLARPEPSPTRIPI